MKRWLLLAALLLITFALSPRFIHQYFGSLLKETTTSNLTSLMFPFELMNQSSTFCCSTVTLQDRYKLEFQQLEHYRLSQSYEQPSINRHSEQYVVPTQPELPYFYSLWQTSTVLPRLITPCEHQVYVKLMKTFDQICRKNDIEYMISYGTLLGSYRNHDILPYDDDVDILVDAKYYSRLSEINKLNNETDWEFYFKTSKNIKFYFRASPSAGNYKWKWPFIGIIFYTDNTTHIEASKVDIEKEIIFPLVLRPVANLWLPGPRNVHMFFKLMAKYYYSNFSIDEKCFLQRYSHRDEKVKYKKKAVNCKKLRNVYPYIRRTCDSDYCHEYLMLNDVTTLYVLKMLKDK